MFVPINEIERIEKSKRRQAENIGNGVIVPTMLLATLNKNYRSQPKLARPLVRNVFTVEEKRGKPLNGKLFHLQSGRLPQRPSFPVLGPASPDTTNPDPEETTGELLHDIAIVPNPTGAPDRAGTPPNLNLLHTARHSHLEQSENPGSLTTCGSAGYHQNIDHNISLHCPSFSATSYRHYTGLVKCINALATVVEA
ncbi:hypothetical protein IscW_ISCW011829 [Ixodes scapularis]|uniref:Uncharacterized protein n=1 Tax=Ixodes scapularis TaxID=6945 RepID=B7Q526_IXOSC|nr:hypothetical protein IscW_ISCW011829 [Ixodes scapularis]|eukprot:XP_002411666.1 hypothetical protein IscW_ISCW011829 [Ixodes scapularis]